MFKPASRHCVNVSDGWVGVIVGVEVGVKVGVGVTVAVAVGVGIGVGQAYITRGMKASNSSFKEFSSSWSKSMEMSLLFA
jgi:hypothetical protein